MRSRLAVLALVSFALAPALSAQFDIDITTTTTTATTGGSASFVGTVRNIDNVTYRAINVTLAAGPGPLVTTTAPGCRPFEAGGISCFIESLAPGATRSFAFTGLVANDAALAGDTFRGSISILALIGDNAPFQRGDVVQVPVTLSPAQVDLGVSFDPLLHSPEPLGITQRTIVLTNHGPSAATRPSVAISASFDPIRLHSANAPWTCTGGDAQRTGRYFLCELPQLGAGQTSRLEIEFETFVARNTTLFVHPWSANATDTREANDNATNEIVSGIASDFAPILIPLLVHETPGALATWTSQLWVWSPGGGATMLFCVPFCPADRNNTIRLYAPRTERLWPFNTDDEPRGAMLYVERNFAPRLSFSSRLFSSRTPPSRGVELPIVREHDFRSERVIIPTVVLDPSHRFLLRVYDPDAQLNGAVRVRVFESFTERVLAERILPLAVRPERILDTTLPAYPGYAETADIFTGLIPPTDSREVGVEVVSVHTGVRLWAFVSATENEGEHVTLITPQ